MKKKIYELTLGQIISICANCDCKSCPFCNVTHMCLVADALTFFDKDEINKEVEVDE